MKIAILGSGGREHALVNQMSLSKKTTKIYCIPGNAGTCHLAENVNLNLIKENLVKRQSKYQEEMDKISQRLSNKGFTDRAPKNIVEQEKTNYSNLKDDIKKISLTIESL